MIMAIINAGNPVVRGIGTYPIEMHFVKCYLLSSVFRLKSSTATFSPWFG